MLSRRDELLALLDGAGAFLPVPADDPLEARRLTTALRAGAPVDDDIALVIATSGTTGVPKGALHTAATLAASATATAQVLGGPGSWLLALPPHHIAGLQVLLRSLAAGHDPVVLDVVDGFDPAAVPAAVDALPGPRRYTSLVPTQLIKVLDHPAATAALAGIDAILVGGAATPPRLAERARRAGLPIVRTYGMSETAGGCVYDGIALPGTEVRIDSPDETGLGRVVLGGPTVARGYRAPAGAGPADHPAFAETGWFRTDDLGRLDGSGDRPLLQIAGRADEAITSGALTVIPQVVEAVIAELPEIEACAVVGLPDDRLGDRVVAAVVPRPGEAIDAATVRTAVTERLGRHAAPREVYPVPELPLRGPGKVDRRALRERLQNSGNR